MPTLFWLQGTRWEPCEQSPTVVPILRLLSETEFWSVLISSHPLPCKYVSESESEVSQTPMPSHDPLDDYSSPCLLLRSVALVFFFAHTPPAYGARWDMKETAVFPFFLPTSCKTNHFICGRVVWLSAGSGRRFFWQGCYFMTALFNLENYKYVIASRLQTEPGPYMRYIQAILAAWFKAQWCTLIFDSLPLTLPSVLRILLYAGTRTWWTHEIHD